MLLIQASVASGGSYYEPSLMRKTAEAWRGDGLLALAGAGSVSPTGGGWMPSSTRRLLGHENSRAQQRLHSSVTNFPWFAGTSGRWPSCFLCQRVYTVTSVPLSKPGLLLWPTDGEAGPCLFPVLRDGASGSSEPIL